MEDTLIGKLNRREAVIGIVGLGYVGLPLVLRFAEVGYRVLGLDVDASKVKTLNAGGSYIEHIPASKIRGARAKGFRATTRFAEAARADALILCVPTPLTLYREPDLSFVIRTTEDLLPHLRRGQVISLESTTYPGTTDEELKPRIESRGFRIGRDVFLVYSPEREDPGNVDFNTRTIPKVCGGTMAACLRVGLALYKQVIDHVVPVSSTRAAEMTKLLENIHRAVNIGLVNEMKMVADRMGLDIFEIIAAAATKPFGFVPYKPGPGLGGHCIPIDPFYLTWKARAYGLNTRFIELAGEVNRSMPKWVLGKVIDALNQHGRALKGSKILVLGLAYKKDVDDSRESPAAEILQLLEDGGAKVAYSDPHIPVFPRKRDYRFKLKSVPLTPATLASYDGVVLATDHKAFDYDLIRKHAKIIVDTRGVYKADRKRIFAA